MSVTPSASAYPPPIQFVQPSTPADLRSNSSGSSDRVKRKRTESSPSNATTTHDFPPAVKSRLRGRYPNECWPCEATNTDVCHVIEKRDSWFGELLEAGLMTFDRLGIEDNSILLCKNCHTQFDDPLNPGFVFLPSDPEYFINFEKDNFRKREQTFQETGYLPRRKCPTADQYEQYLRDTGQLSGGVGLGGLYHIYILKRYFGKHGNKPWMPGRDPTGPKQWHGAPMAAIRRGISALGGMICRIPQPVRDQLRELQDLYSREPEEGVSQLTAGNTKQQSVNRTVTGGATTDTSPGTSGSPPHLLQAEPDTPQAPATTHQPHDDEPRWGHSDSAVDLRSTQEYQNSDTYCAKRSCKNVGCSEHELHHYPYGSTKRKRDPIEEGYMNAQKWKWGRFSSSNDKIQSQMKEKEPSSHVSSISW